VDRWLRPNVFYPNNRLSAFGRLESEHQRRRDLFRSKLGETATEVRNQIAHGSVRRRIRLGAL